MPFPFEVTFEQVRADLEAHRRCIRLPAIRIHDIAEGLRLVEYPSSSRVMRN